MIPTGSNLFILGTATNGALFEPTLVSSLDEAKKMFGGVVYETHSIEAADTSLWLDYPAKKDSIRTYRVDSYGRLYPTKVYNIQRDNTCKNLVTFESLGTATLLVISYDRKYEENEVLKFYEESYSLLSDSNIYLVRISGAVAQCSLLDGGGNLLIKLYAKYPGDIYNNIRVDITASSLIFSFPNGLCPTNTRQYTLSSTKMIGDLLREINAHSQLGLNVVTTSSIIGTTPINVSSNSLATGTFYLSGGADQLALDVETCYNTNGTDYDAFTTSLLNTLEYIKGMDADILLCPLPIILKAAKVLPTYSVMLMAYDWDCNEFFGHDESFAISGNIYSTTPGTYATSISIPSEDDGGLSTRFTPAGDGQFSIAAPSSITIGGRTATFQYWMQYGSFQGLSSFSGQDQFFASTSNPLQITLHAGTAVAIAVYKTLSIGINRSFVSLPEAQTPQSWGTAYGKIIQYYGQLTDQYSVSTLCMILARVLREEREAGKLPFFIFPCLRRSYDPE
jgi:hypothetical protein